MVARLLAVSVLLFSLASGRQCQASDSALVAYELDSALENTFDSLLEVIWIPPFWGAWDTVALDYIDITPANSGRGGFTAVDDARLFVRAAWGEKGLYLWFRLVDDLVPAFNWCDPPCLDQMEYINRYGDIFTFYFNPLPSASFRTGNQMRALCTAGRYWYAAGTASVGDQFRLDRSSWLGECLPTHCGVTAGACDTVNETVVLSSLGILTARSRGCYLAATETVQHLEIPWQYISGDTNSGWPTRGREFALSLSYFDMDEDESVYPLHHQTLAWRNRSYPLLDLTTIAPTDSAAGFCWGDIILGEPLDSAVARAGVVRQPWIARHVQALAPGARAEHFSVTGRRIDVTGVTSSSQHARGLVLVRTGERGALGRRILFGQ